MVHAEPSPTYMAQKEQAVGNYTLLEAQTNADNADVDIVTGRWASGLCDFVMPNGFMVVCCSWIAIAQVCHRVNCVAFFPSLAAFALPAVLLVVMVATINVGTHGVKDLSVTEVSWSWGMDTGKIPYKADLPAHFWVLFAIAALVQLGGFFGVVSMRESIRRKLSIPGSCCGDCVVLWCCYCCAIMQMATHVQSYTPGSCSFGYRDVLPAFVSEDKDEKSTNVIVEAKAVTTSA